ncbi:GTPase activating protein (Gyp5) [Aspergillus nomiae NRRL 13137]|uniref:GTPase-activating protein GYP5 n=1 Tax=Aspergillus nomiae NRRL (strain ATCC 15546 / NRRL 13137 / CBS 260.88 / M93) TaxID=1509407 RepID=A0A0L1J3F7_ASPN3|nr:GTPase activating protein (Gyp5) [Aspergillus nomiae NRRL 13137]KNG85933.1 GTPase activating protein (Gyp5) [Aspergillus nomiae NRRL 13137]
MSRRSSRDYEGDTFDDALEAPTSQNNLTVSIPQSSSTRSLTDSPPSASATTPQLTDAPSLPTADQDEVKTNGETVDAHSDTRSEAEETPRKQKLQKSPLLTAHRLSTTSLAEVNLASNNKDDESFDNHDISPGHTPSSPPLSSMESMSAQNPRLSDPAPPVIKNTAPAAPPPPPARKLTGPFAWLTRSSTGSKETKSPPQNSRRSTAASISTISSNPEMAGRTQDGEDQDGASTGSRKPARNSLKDQFKMLRMRDEGLVSENDEASVASGRASISQPAGSPPPSIPEEGENDSAAITATSPPNVSATVNPNLAPGTVSGFSASATDAAAPVDWELWQQLVNGGPQALKGANSEELNAAIKRGIPQTIRGVIWQVLADSRNPELEEVYRELVARGTEKEKARTSNGTTNGDKESASSSRSSIRSEHSGSAAHSVNGSPSPSHEVDPEKLAKEQATSEAARKKKEKEDGVALQKLEKTIRRDLGARTSYSRYFVSQGNQEGLFGLCKAYALYDEAVGYAQGMNFIVMPLLFNMDEAEAFTLLVKLMNHYGLREMFIHDMPGLHRSLFLFERLLEDMEPALYCHLRRRGVHPQLYATQWFLTLFAYRFPLQLVLRIYDLILDEGLENTILKFAIAIMHRNSEALLGMKDMTPLTTFLKERLFDVYIDKQPSASSILESGFFGSSGAADKEVYRADLLVQDACAVPLDRGTIRAYTAEWEEKVRTEREREQELENLKHTVATQSARIRLLEEQAEASDKEHVHLASELVHLKVENEELTDLNDALNMQVKNLKIVVDQQPAEVEEKLQTEMDRIMKRNMEVQNENRSMVEQMAEMEKELVEAKMKWAEIHEDHENLKQKWSDLRKALD